MTDGSMGRQSAQFVSDLGDALRRNPVSTALIGMGVLWLFTGGKAGDRVARLAKQTGFDRVPEAVQDGFNALGDRIGDVGGAAGDLAQSATRGALDRAANVTNSVADFGRSIPGSGAEFFAFARSRLGDLFDDQPLVLGALGVALGAGIAASLPATRLEADYFGNTADELKSRATDFAHQQTERVQTAAIDAASAAVDEARRQGLTPDGFIAAAAEGIGERVRRVAAAAGDSVRQNVE